MEQQMMSGTGPTDAGQTKMTTPHEIAQRFTDMLSDVHEKEDIALAAKLEATCAGPDSEANHILADDILSDKLLELGYVKTVTAWHAVGKNFGPGPAPDGPAPTE